MTPTRGAHHGNEFPLLPPYALGSRYDVDAQAMGMVWGNAKEHAANRDTYRHRVTIKKRHNLLPFQAGGAASMWI